jgi:hypothetical protein
MLFNLLIFICLYGLFIHGPVPGNGTLSFGSLTWGKRSLITHCPTMIISPMPPLFLCDEIIDAVAKSEHGRLSYYKDITMSGRFNSRL